MAAAPPWVAALPSDEEEEDGLQLLRCPEADLYVVEDDDVQVVNVMKHERRQAAEATEQYAPARKSTNFVGGAYHFAAATEAPMGYHQHLEISPWERRESKARQERRLRPANFAAQTGSRVDGQLYDTLIGLQPRARGFLGESPASQSREGSIFTVGPAPHSREFGIQTGRWRSSLLAKQGPIAAPGGPIRMPMGFRNGRTVVQEQFNNAAKPQFREHGILGGGLASQLREREMFAEGSALQFREERLPVLDGMFATGPTTGERLSVPQLGSHGRYAGQKQYGNVGVRLSNAMPGSLKRMFPENVQTDLSPLHWDILRFCNAHELTPEQIQVRREALQYVEHAVHEIWPSAEVHLFGSTATGLALPWSDIDVAVMSSPNGQNSTSMSWQAALGRVLKRHGQCRSLKHILHAKVPLLKVVFKSGLACDISFDAMNGPRGVPVIRQFMQQYEALRPLCLVLKFFLGQHDLNELWKGGLGSFCLINMVVSHLQKLGVNGGGQDLGALLLSFFTRYTTMHNYRTDVVSTKADFSVTKQAKGWVNGKAPELLAVEDPLDSTSDIAKGSYKIHLVRTWFLKAQRVLVAHWHQENVLGQVVDMTCHPNRKSKLQVENCSLIKKTRRKIRKRSDNIGRDQERTHLLQPESKQKGKRKGHPCPKLKSRPSSKKRARRSGKGGPSSELQEARKS